MSAIDKHLEDVTVDNLNQFKQTAFIRYASSGKFELGVDADGKFIVKNKKTPVRYVYCNASEAIEKYKKLLGR